MSAWTSGGKKGTRLSAELLMTSKIMLRMAKLKIRSGCSSKNLHQVVKAKNRQPGLVSSFLRLRVSSSSLLGGIVIFPVQICQEN